MSNVTINSFFDEHTSTFTYVVKDIGTNECILIDPVLTYDQYSGNVDDKSANTIIHYIKNHNLHLKWILETHIHADHITAAYYIKSQIGGLICIGAKIIDVLNLWVPMFNTYNDTMVDGSQFDVLLQNEQVLTFGNQKVRVMHTPGHTPACCSYIINDNIFVGDTIFMPDVGTARTDFPGGDAATLYQSIQKILSLPDDTKIFMCHDYPPRSRKIQNISTIKDQKDSNIMIKRGITEEEYVLARNQKDANNNVPKMLLPSIQTNLRAGYFGKPDNNSTQYIKIPINKI